MNKMVCRITAQPVINILLREDLLKVTKRRGHAIPDS